MCRCIKNNSVSAQKILVTNDNKIIGINLGYDFVDEHERGIKEIRNFFEIDNFALGLEGYSIKKKDLEKNLIYSKINIKNTNYVCLMLLTSINNHFPCIDEKSLQKASLYPLENIISISEEELYPGLYTAWNSNSFGILAEEKYESYIKDLYDAFLNGDISLDIHTDNFFPVRGLTICINSRIPQNTKYEIYKKDFSDLKLLCSVEKAGIIKLLEESNKEYFDLTPKWKDESETEIIFYLNPKKQEQYKTGWFLYNDLVDWTKDTGCIVK